MVLYSRRTYPSGGQQRAFLLRDKRCSAAGEVKRDLIRFPTHSSTLKKNTVSNHLWITNNTPIIVSGELVSYILIDSFDDWSLLTVMIWKTIRSSAILYVGVDQNPPFFFPWKIHSVTVVLVGGKKKRRSPFGSCRNERHQYIQRNEVFWGS